MGRGFDQSLFSPPKNKRLAGIIKIDSPAAFRGSIQEIKKDGVTLEEKRALVLAQNRSRAQLQRQNLSMKERREFEKIVSMDLPKITRR